MIEAIVILAAISVLFYQVRKHQKKDQQKQEQQALKSPSEQQDATESTVEHLRQQRAEEKAKKRVHKQDSQETAQVATSENLPQDSTLRRHYLAHLKMMVENSVCPRPSESTLRRHHDNMVNSQIEACLDDEEKMFALVSDYEASSHLDTVEIITSEIETVSVEIATCRKIPEDSMLKRHFIAQALAVIESNLPACPSDSTLKRHHQQLIATQLAAFLAA